VQAILVALAGGVGTLLRYGIGLATARLGAELPIGTFLVNVIGSFALGFVAEALEGVVVLDTDARLILGTGLLGGFTTYSSFNLETLKLAQDGQPWLAAAYAAATLLGCLVAGGAGIALARLR
jgi:CrcB protein